MALGLRIAQVAATRATSCASASDLVYPSDRWLDPWPRNDLKMCDGALIRASVTPLRGFGSWVLLALRAGLSWLLRGEARQARLHARALPPRSRRAVLAHGGGPERTPRRGGSGQVGQDRAGLGIDDLNGAPRVHRLTAGELTVVTRRHGHRGAAWRDRVRCQRLALPPVLHAKLGAVVKISSDVAPRFTGIVLRDDSRS